MAERLPALGVDLPAPGEKLDLAAAFPGRPREIWLEIGFGGGEHLAWQAERHPNIGFIGAEVFEQGVARLLRRLDDAGLANVRVHHGDGRDMIDALPEHAIGRVFVLFPDPWPKARHHKRRLIRADIVTALAGIMTDRAELRLATDDMDYVRWMLERLVGHPAFEWTARGAEDWRTRPDDWPETRYEAKARAQGRRPAFLRFRRRPRERA